MLGLILFSAMLVLALVVVVTSGIWPNLLYVVEFAGLDVFYVIWGTRIRRKLDRMAAQLDA